MTTVAARKPTTRLNELTATEMAAAVAAGGTTSEAIVRACIERIEAREREVLAWQYFDAEQALAQARAFDRSGRRGALGGVPFGIKDIIDTCDMPTEMGSPIYAGHRPRGDAAVVALSRKAGGVLMGKTVTTEFANRFPGKTRNPFDASRTPGGSSQGSAAAVGDFMVPLAIGTQTTGSTIRPAAFCGTVGYRPTWGDIRCVGVKEAAGSLDTVGSHRALGRGHRALPRCPSRQRARAAAGRSRRAARRLLPHAFLAAGGAGHAEAARRRGGQTGPRRSEGQGRHPAGCVRRASRKRTSGSRATSSRATSPGRSRITGRS